MILDIKNEKEKGIYDEIWKDKVYGEVHPGESVLDIGANVGYFTLYALATGAKVIAFEPEPENFIRLDAQVKENDFMFASGHAFQMAVAGDDKGKKLYLNPENIGGHRITHDIEGRFVEVASITLDEVMEQHGPFDMMKMDCEGAEHGYSQPHLPRH